MDSCAHTAPPLRTSRRRPATVCPTGWQRALAYAANGDMPPLRLPHPIITDGLISFTISTTACLALGVLIGSAVA
jgi:hypothetical protein